MFGRGNKGWIGVDLGTHTVKLAQVERRGGRTQLVDAVIIRRRDPWQSDNSNNPLSPRDSAEEIRAALALGRNFSGNIAAVGLPMSLCSIRACAVPEGSDADQRAAVAEQLAMDHGAVEENREFDFWDTTVANDTHPPAENMLALSITRDWAEQVTRDASGSRLSAATLDGLPLALARAADMSVPGGISTPTAIVDWGYRYATLVIVQHGRPLFVRVLRDAGFSGVLAALCKGLSVSLEEAQKLLTDHGLPVPDSATTDELSEVMRDVIEPSLQGFVDEVNRTVAYLRQQRRALAPQQLILFGGGAAVKNIDTCVAHLTELPTRTWQLERIPPTVTSYNIPLALLGPAIALSSLAWSPT